MLSISDKLELELKAKLFRGFADTSRLAILEALTPAEQARFMKLLSKLVDAQTQRWSKRNTQEK